MCYVPVEIMLVTLPESNCCRDDPESRNALRWITEVSIPLNIIP
jgi:hypothetical protein